MRPSDEGLIAGGPADPASSIVVEARPEEEQMVTGGSSESSIDRAVRMLAASNPRRSPLRLLVTGIAPPLAVFAVELLFSHPTGRWSLFYPVVFACAWFGGIASGLVATLLSAALVWWAF